MAAALGFAWDLRVALMFVAVMGYGVALTNIVGQIILQLTLVDDIRGHVFSVYGMLFGCVPGIGALAMGWAIDQWGLGVPVVLGAAIGLATSTVIFLHRHRIASLLETPR